MRFIYALLAIAIAANAFAQAGANPRWKAVATPTPSAVQNPAFEEETVTFDPNPDQPVTQKKSTIPYAKLPPNYADMLTQADQAKVAAQQKFYDKTPTPMLSPDGKQLVGIVGNRYLTMEDLNKRADLLMKMLPAPEKSLGTNAAVVIAAGAAPQIKDADSKQSEEDRRILIEGRVLDDWARAATLAVHAEQAAAAIPQLRVTDAEIDQAIKKLSAEAQINVAKIPVALQTVMFSERELRQEARDGLLVDKYMREYVRRMVTEQEMQELFKKTPELFLDPTRVHVWGMCIAKEGFATPSQAAKAEKELSRWRGSLKGCKTLDDFKELGAKIVKDKTHVILSDMGWVQSTDPFDREILKALFSLKPGETSEVVESVNGYHLYKVMERTEGDKLDYAIARPHIVDYLASSLKDGVYDSIRGQHGLRMAASGLMKWKVNGPAKDVVAERVAAALGTSITAIRTPISVGNEPNLNLLRQRTGGAGRHYNPSIPPVESVVGGRAVTRSSRPLNALATPKPLATPSR